MTFLGLPPNGTPTPVVESKQFVYEQDGDHTLLEHLPDWIVKLVTNGSFNASATASSPKQPTQQDGIPF